MRDLVDRVKVVLVRSGVPQSQLFNEYDSNGYLKFWHRTDGFVVSECDASVVFAFSVYNGSLEQEDLAKSELAKAERILKDAGFEAVLENNGYMVKVLENSEVVK